MVNKLSRILVAIDFSDPSLKAIETAASIAKQSKATLYGLHVQDDTLEFIGSPSLTMKSVSENTTNILAALAADIRNRYGIELMFFEETGNATETILKSAVKHRCEMIVAGTYGASGFRAGHIGTTAYSVVKYAPCPVLLVPPHKTWNSFSHPLLPVRPVITAFRHYDFIRHLLAPNATLNVLGVYNNNGHDVMYDIRDLVLKIEKKLTADNITAEVTVCNSMNSIPQIILREAEEKQSDVIIITPATDVSNKQFYIGPNMHFIIHNARVPVLVINRVNKFVMEAASL
jgi:nucleotide-binding universal stress UspA family protein